MNASHPLENDPGITFNWRFQVNSIPRSHSTDALFEIAIDTIHESACVSDLFPHREFDLKEITSHMEFWRFSLTQCHRFL
jgi:hypothetical protein